MEELLQLVKVRYIIKELEGGLSSRAYTYFSEEPLAVGDEIIVPVRDTTTKAQVCEVNVDEAEIEGFRDKVKIIPANSKVGVPIGSVPNETETVIRVDPGACLAPTDEMIPLSPHLSQTDADITDLTLRSGEDMEALGYFEEARKMLEYAERRVIKTLEDAKLATDDLILISKLKKAMDAKRKEKLAPHEAQLKAIRDTYTYLMTPILEAERITKSKQVAFLQEQERIQREQEEINRLREEASQKQKELTGEITEVETVEVSGATERVSTTLASSGLTDHWVFEVVDFAQVPDTYKVIDNALLTAIARKHHDTKPVPGVKFLNKPYLATRSK